jgi:hypothetical protein
VDVNVGSDNITKNYGVLAKCTRPEPVPLNVVYGSLLIAEKGLQARNSGKRYLFSFSETVIYSSVMDSLSKLSKLQKLILIAHSELGYEGSRKERDEMIYNIYFGGSNSTARAALYRAYKRLEMRGLIKRMRGNWTLTNLSDGQKGQCGELAAFILLPEIQHAGGTLEWLKKYKQRQNKARQNPG